MGKASKWFRGLLGLKKTDPNSSQKPPAKKKWSFAKPHKEKDHQRSQHTTAAPSGFNDDHASRHAIAVAAATAAVAEAAVVAAQAAAAVVKLTGAGGGTSVAGSGGVSNSAACVSENGAGYGTREKRAAVTIQSHFRAYLARRALRALKALVKLQALAKGYICRKQFTKYLHQMHAIARAQERARAGRVFNSEASNSSTKSSFNFNHNSPATPEKFEHNIAKSTKHHQQLMLLNKRNGSKSNSNVTYDPENSHSIRGRWMSRRAGERSWEQGSFTRIVPLTDDEKSDKILEVDTGKPHFITPKYRNVFRSSSHLNDIPYCQSFSTPNPSSAGEVQSFSPLKFARDHAGESNYFFTADNSPQHCSASPMGGGSSKRAPLTPTKSDGSKSYVSGYFDHPNYMAYTESSKAKARSVSAPKQRPHNQYERSSSSAAGNRYSVHGFGNNNNDQSRLNLNNGQKVSALHASFTSKDYPGSGRLDRLGMPIRDVSGFSGGHWHRY